MKKSNIFFKALIGIPIGIFTLEMLNIAVSIIYGEYIRLDCLGNYMKLETILKTYIYCILSSYMISICIFNSVEISKLDISIHEKTKKMNKLNFPLIILLTVIMILTILINLNDYYIFGFIPSFIWTGLTMVVYAFKSLKDKYTIREINKKLKENIKL